MEPKIIFLGTAGDSLVYGNQIRSSGGIVLQMDGMQFIIDPGPGCVSRCADYGINIRNTTAVFVTHNHINHANDINAVISAMTYNGLDKRGVLISNKTAFNGQEKMSSKTICIYNIGVGNTELLANKKKYWQKGWVGRYCHQLLFPLFFLQNKTLTKMFPPKKSLTSSALKYSA